MSSVELRPLSESDRAEYGQMLHSSFNTWYANHGWQGDYFRCDPQATEIFFDIYDDLTPGCSVAAFDTHQNDQMMGACFYHPRERHVSLGIMAVHPDYFGRGVGKTLTKHIVDYAEQNGYDAVRLVGSAMNVDSFSLYNAAGFVPRSTYHDMIIPASSNGHDREHPLIERVREATMDDVESMGRLELEVSGIQRELDYRYCIDNKRCIFKTLVIESEKRGIDGFIIAVVGYRDVSC